MVRRQIVLMDEGMDTQVETGAAVIFASKLFLIERHSWKTVYLLLYFPQKSHL